MTAIVGVLNKHAVAIAADSAVTMGNTHKVVNSANKIFTLSKYHPVAIMTYSNAAFMGVPWDIIIKEYRKQLKDVSFSHLREYMDDFLQFIHLRDFFCDAKTQENYLSFALHFFWNACSDFLEQDKKEVLGPEDADKIKQHLEQVINNIKTWGRCPEFEDYSYDDFTKLALTHVKDFANSKGFLYGDLLCESFFHYLCSKISLQVETGLVFVGYGESEIYPSLFPINISLAIDGHLRYYIDEHKVAQISEHGSGAIISPFAQTDVIQTIVRGINPTFQDIIYNVINKSIKIYTDSITNILDKDPVTKLLSEAVKNLDLEPTIIQITKQINAQMKKTYTDPLLNTIKSLDKEDMANMAESFIALTSLVRRMQPGEETVGGPVDVAVISKGDGFVWINRKHYFNPDLNASFFANYFK